MRSKDSGFSKGFRLTDAREFDNVFQSATLRRRHGALRLSAVGNTMHTARLGLVVGKRALPDAHDRNRAKRVLRETFRKRRAQLPSVDLVVQVISDDVSSGGLKASFDTLLDYLQESFP